MAGDSMINWSWPTAARQSQANRYRRRTSAMSLPPPVVLEPPVTQAQYKICTKCCRTLKAEETCRSVGACRYCCGSSRHSISSSAKGSLDHILSPRRNSAPTLPPLALLPRLPAEPPRTARTARTSSIGAVLPTRGRPHTSYVSPYRTLQLTSELRHRYRHPRDSVPMCPCCPAGPANPSHVTGIPKNPAPFIAAPKYPATFIGISELPAPVAAKGMAVGAGAAAGAPNTPAAAASSPHTPKTTSAIEQWVQTLPTPPSTATARDSSRWPSAATPRQHVVGSARVIADSADWTAMALGQWPFGTSAYVSGEYTF